MELRHALPVLSRSSLYRPALSCDLKASAAILAHRWQHFVALSLILTLPTLSQVATGRCLQRFSLSLVVDWRAQISIFVRVSHGGRLDEDFSELGEAVVNFLVLLRKQNELFATLVVFQRLGHVTSSRLFNTMPRLITDFQVASLLLNIDVCDLAAWRSFVRLHREYALSSARRLGLLRLIWMEQEASFCRFCGQNGWVWL